MKFSLLLLLFMSFGALADAQSLKNFFDNKTKIENPFNLRDPFKAPAVKRDQTQTKKEGFIKSGQGSYTNIQETPLEQINLNDLRVVGVLIGKERRALVKLGAEDKNVTILKEGMKIGQEEAELKAILPGGIVLVEKIVNVYGEEEYLETVVPISK